MKSVGFTARCHSIMAGSGRYYIIVSGLAYKVFMDRKTSRLREELSLHNDVQVIATVES